MRDNNMCMCESKIRTVHPFEESYDFNEREKETLRLWDENDLFHKLKKKNKGGKKYRFIDGPITANNPMGIHHVWGRTLKDTFLRYKAMKGYDSHYRNGFDGQGLWVEVEVEKELGFTSKRDIETYGIDRFTDKCIERVKRCSEIITGQSKRLGQWMDWDNSYYTYTDDNITGIWSFLKQCHEHGWIKKIHRPMPWCPRCGTSLSEHEMSGSYRELEHEAVFFKLPLEELNASMLVWTTTPWTLSANVALAVNPGLEYCLVSLDKEDKPLIMGRRYYDAKLSGSPGAKLIRVYKGSELEGMHYETCFPELPAQKDVVHRVVLWEDVLDDEGSGIVHIAPGCGAEDYELGISLGLSAIAPINEAGIFYEDFGFFSGKSAQLVRTEVIDELRSRRKLFYSHKYKHSYPVCWRCKSEVLFRLVDEWAIGVEDIRPVLIANAAKVKWNPEYQGKRMKQWLENMGDWCISRSRYYGLPLPIYECKGCSQVTVIGSLKELRALAVSPEAVDKLPHLHRPWIDEVKIICPCCGSAVDRINQVGDVWLDAGIVPFSTLKYFEDRDYWKEYFPAEYILEMKEQVRLWFYSMLFMSTVITGEPPYEQVGTHGMVTAEDGSRFSKTGNMIRFDDAAERIGADASRYLFALASPASDVRFGYNLGTEARKKLLSYYNIAVFFSTYAAIDKPHIDFAEMHTLQYDPTDLWLLARINIFLKEASQCYEAYNTRDIVLKFEQITDELSNFYIRVNRRRFWESGYSSSKHSAYTVLLYAIKILTQVMAPILPFMTEYIWQSLICAYSEERLESVHLTDWPSVKDEYIANSQKLLDAVEATREIIALALKIRNEKQLKIKQKLSQLLIYAEDDRYKLDDYFKSVLINEINTGTAEYIDDPGILKIYSVKLNLRQAGAVLRGRLNEAVKAISLLSPSDMNSLAQRLNRNEGICLPGFETELPHDLFITEAVPREGFCIAESNGLVIALDITITEELKNEGLLRGILRQCQVARKNAGFRVSDKILLSLQADKEIMKLLEDNKDILEHDLLAVTRKDFPPEYMADFEVDGHKIRACLSKQTRDNQ